MESQETKKCKDLIYVRLNCAQYELLSKLLISGLKSNLNEYYLIGDKIYINKVLEQISDKLIQIGLDINDSPNELGLELENLIDIINQKLYKH